MSVSSATAAIPSATTSSTASAAAASGGITSSSFLTLLIGELQNQDPLDPTSTSDFINQMSQYATFDATQQLDTQLGTLLTSLNSLLTMNSVNYIGHDVIAKGDTTSLQNGAATFGYSLKSAAQQVSLSIQDASGNVVWSGSGTTTAGANSFTWDGTTSDGKQLTSGQYKLTVTAADSNGNSVYDFSTITGKVSSVDSSSGTTMLDIGGASVSINNVVGVTS
ncbi:MAG: FlgD immunoglobulin-like domain containing protein [Pseudomonadota bacterium]